MSYKTVSTMLITVLCLTVAASLSSANSMDNLAIHGFGGWAYGKTSNGNRYLAARPDGSYEHLYFSLNFTAKPYEQVSIHVQPAFDETTDGHEVGLDYAFAEWGFSDALKLRVGKVIAPFLLYTEVYDVGTIRPFYFLPPGLYQELAAEAYSGAGLTGRIFTAHDWEIQYDLYGGKLTLQPQYYISLNSLEFGSTTPNMSDMLGGRLLVRTPLDGLAFALSSYRGELNFEIERDLDLSDHYTGIGLSAEYITSPWWFRTEYFTQSESSKITMDIAYAEAAYSLTEHWQIATRYEFVDLEIPLLEDVFPTSFLEHQELTCGLNYWVNPSLVLKGAYHLVIGNRFAYPEDFGEYLEQIQRGYFDEDTNVFTFGVQFSF